MASLLTIIGTGASIIGALISYWQAMKAKKNVSEVEKYKNEFINRLEWSDFESIYKDVKGTIKSMRSMVVKPTLPPGFELNLFLSMTMKCTEQLTENQNLFSENDSIKLQSKIKAIDDFIKKIRQERSSKRKYEHCIGIYHTFKDLLPILKDTLNDKRVS